MYGPAGGGSRAGAAGGTELPLPHPSRAESTSEGNRLPDHGPPDALVGGRLRRQPPSGAGPRPSTTRPEAVRPSGAGHVHRGKRQGLAAPVRDRPVLGRDPHRTTRHGSARAWLGRLAGEARGRARPGDRGGAGAGQAARHRGRVRGAPESHQSPARRRARRAREPAPRRHRAARPHRTPALDALRRDAVALECVGYGQGRPRGAGGRAAGLRGQGPEGSLRPDGESSDRARDRRSATHMAPAMRARALLVLAGVTAAAPGAAQTGATTRKTESAVFAGGCFWGVDAVFRHVRGVTAVVSGYAGGGAATAHYDLVSTATTGHAESVEVTFDPARVSYAELLRGFFTVAHDPTERDPQGPDVGSQYRSVVFYGTPEQHAAARAMIAALERE